MEKTYLGGVLPEVVGAEMERLYASWENLIMLFQYNS